MKAIGSMGGTMGMGLRGGLEEADTRVNIDKDRGMGMGFIDSTQGTLMLGSGAMGRAMALECRLALMVAAMLVNSSMALSMALVATILGKFFKSCFRNLYSVAFGWICGN